MTIQVDAIVGGTEYDLTGSGITILEVADLGHAPLERHTERGPNQHGDTDTGFRLLPRVFSIVVMLRGEDADEVFSERARLIRIFKTSRVQLALRFTFEDGSQRQIDCVTVGGLDLRRDGKAGKTQKTAVMLRAANPLFYDPVSSGAVTINLGGGSGGFTIPTPVPTSVGSSTADASQALTYDGTWESNPVIRITGPITSPVITNETTGDVLDFTGTTISAGSYYDIDTRYGYKTVYSESGVNKISTLLDTSDLATFALQPDPDAADGINVISVTGTGTNADTRVDLTFFDWYVGI